MSPSTSPPGAIPFFRPDIRTREVRAVSRVLRSGWLTTGAQAQAFEEEFRQFLSPDADSPALHCLAVNSATSGLHLALEAAGVGPGDLVAVPAMTFTATAEVVRYLGADPVFIDSSDRDWNIDPARLADAVDRLAGENRRIRAVIAVHLAGLACDMEALRDAAGPDAVMIEDAAHAFPCRTDSGMAGTLGDIGVFSFYATKTITTGEGGMVVTRNPLFARRMRTMRLHGIDRSVWNRYSADAGERSWEYDVIAPGYKYNMTDIAAALGRSQLARAEKLLRMRSELARMYNRAFAGHPLLSRPPGADGHAWHLYILNTESSVLRDRICRALAEEKIGSSVHFIPLHRMTYWKNRYELKSSDFPVADRLADTNLSLPLWPGLGRRQIRRIAGIIRNTADG